MVIHTQIQLQVIFVVVNLERGRLFAAFIASGGLACFHGCQEAFAHRFATGIFVGLCCVFNDLWPFQHVACDA